MKVCAAKQHDFRNSVLNLEGWIKELRKKDKIDAYDHDTGMFYLKRLAVCSKLDKLETMEKKP